MEPGSSETSAKIGDILKNINDGDKKTVRCIEATRNKIIKAESSLAFNLVCLQENILPGYTEIKLHDESARNEESTRRFRRELVERQVEDKKKVIYTLREELRSMEKEWNEAPIPTDIKNQINRKLKEMEEQHRRGVESGIVRKLSRLYGDSIKLPRPPSGYVNLSDHTLTKDQEELLDMGLNCHFLTKPRPHRKRLEIEVLLDDIQHLEKSGQVKTTPDLQPSLLAEASKIRGSHQSKNISRNHIQAAKELRDNHSITIRRADKTAAFVIIDKEEYTHKMDTILSDTTKFRRITRNPTESIKKKLNSIIASINANMDSPKFPKLTGEYSLGYAFGNIKTHKPGNPLRPIISQIPTATYPIAKKLNDLLTPYVPSTYTIASSSDFLEILRDSPSNEDTIIASLDVESLFTNVDVDRTIDFILNRVYRCGDTTPLNIPERSLKMLLEICTKEAPFTCPSGRMYKQIDGVAMGSPLGVLFANFFMGTIEAQLLAESRPSIYCRYVDDIFVRIRDLNELQALKDRFIMASGLNFTFEESTNGHLPFLDVLVKAQHSGFITTVYTKPTNPGLCLNGRSECPTRYLHSSIGAYVRRALSHCSTWKDTHQEIERLTQVLVNNGYANSEVTRITKRILDRWYTKENSATPDKKNSITLYYKNHMSTDYKTDEKIMEEIINKNIQATDPEKHLRLIIYYKTKKTSQLIIRNQPNITKTPLQEDHVVYQYNCSSEECGSHNYIGMTTTKLTRRLTCHLTSGSIKSHHSTSHNQALTRKDLDTNTTIIDTEKDPRRLMILEAIYIQAYQPRINIQTEDLQALPSMRRLSQDESNTYTRRGPAILH